MDIPIETVAGWVATGAAIIGHFFVANYRLERTEKELEKAITNYAKEMADVWKWKNSHEREANDMREKYQSQLSELKGTSLVIGEQFKQIMALLTEIRERLTDLENHKNGRN